MDANDAGISLPEEITGSVAEGGHETDKVRPTRTQFDVELLEGDGFTTLVRTEPLEQENLRFGSAVFGKIVVAPDTGCFILAGVEDAVLVLPHGSTVKTADGVISVTVEGYDSFAVGDSLHGDGVSMGADALISLTSDTGPCLKGREQTVSELYVPISNASTQ